jgi:hypothetical protein
MIKSFFIFPELRIHYPTIGEFSPQEGEIKEDYWTGFARETECDPDGGRPTVKVQWWASRGRKSFREMPINYGFKMARSIHRAGERNSTTGTYIVNSFLN